MALLKRWTAVIALGVASGLYVCGMVLFAGIGVPDVRALSPYINLQRTVAEARWNYWPGYRETVLAQAFERGYKDAKSEIENGRFRILTTGGPPRIWDSRAYRAFEDLSYEIQPIASCVVEPEVGAYAAGFNSIAILMFERRHGRGSYMQVWDDMRTKYESDI